MIRAAALATLLLVGCQKASAAPDAPPPPPPPEPALATLSLEAVDALRAQPGVHLYDANPREMYEHGHLPGAAWVPFDAVTADVLPADRAATLVFYCANELCTASHTAARSALALGYAHTFVMPAGFFGWKKSGRPVARPDAG